MTSATPHRAKAQTAIPGQAPLLDVRDLQVEYLSPRGPVRAVDGVTFAIHPGEVFGLAGESGSGKSTIAHAITRILHPPAVITGGEVRFRGEDVLAMPERRPSWRWWGSRRGGSTPTPTNSPAACGSGR